MEKLLKKNWIFVLYTFLAFFLTAPLFFIRKSSFIRLVFDLFIFRFKLIPFLTVLLFFVTTFLVDFFFSNNEKQFHENYTRLKEVLGSGRNGLKIAALALLSGFTEELLFRGYLLFLLVKLLVMPPFLGVVIVSLLFGFLHVNQGKTAFFVSTLVSGILCYFVLSTGSLVIPFVFHAGFNFIQLYFVLPLQKKRYAQKEE